MYRHSLSLVTMLWASACASTSVANPSGLAAGIGRTALLDGVRVTPTGLVEDSRCPTSVRCIWAGRLRIEVTITIQGGSEELRQEMTLGQAVWLPEGRLMLSAAEPAPAVGKPIAPDAYRFSFSLVP